jgi:hypothetical protein
MRAKPRRLAVLAVATSLAAGAANAGGASAETSRPVHSAAHWVVISEAPPRAAPSAPRDRAAVVKPPASVTGLARDLGVSTGFASRTLDELARSDQDRAR